VVSAGLTRRLSGSTRTRSPRTRRPAGACPECHGLGQVHRTTEELLVPDPALSIREGAQPVVTVHLVRDADRIQRPYQGTYMSAHRYVMLHPSAPPARAFPDSRSPTLRAKAERFPASAPCPACGGSRLRPEALAVTVGGRTITELAALPLLEPATTLDGTSETARVLTDDLRSRIAPVVELGLGYLGLDRATPTPSAGELQRLRLAPQLRSATSPTHTPATPGSSSRPSAWSVGSPS
jgi:excinuclease ABC subunit A